MQDNIPSNEEIESFIVQTEKDDANRRLIDSFEDNRNLSLLDRIKIKLSFDKNINLNQMIRKSNYTMGDILDKSLSEKYSK